MSNGPPQRRHAFVVTALVLIVCAVLLGRGRLHALDAFALGCGVGGLVVILWRIVERR